MSWHRIIGIVLVWPLAAIASEQPLSIEESVALALANAPQVSAGAADVDGAQAASISAGRLPDPELIAGVDNLPVNTADRFSFTRDFMTMRRVGVMQSFPNRAKRRLQSERGEREVALAQAQLRSTRFETARAAADAWIASAVADRSLARLKALEPDVDMQAVAARAGLASGRASAADALTAQSMAIALKERLLELRQESEMQRAELRRWIGADAARPLAEIPTDAELGHSPQALLASVADHAPLAPMSAELAVAQTEVELARSEKRPDWSAELSYARRGPDFSDMVSLEVRVGLPLFSAHRQNPVVAEKIARLRSLEAGRDAALRMHSAEIESALAEWRAGRERLQLYQTDLIPLARDRSRTALASYGAGRTTLASVVDALSRDIDTQLAYVQLEGAVARTWTFLHFLHDAEVSK